MLYLKKRSFLAAAICLIHAHAAEAAAIEPPGKNNHQTIPRPFQDTKEQTAPPAQTPAAGTKTAAPKPGQGNNGNEIILKPSEAWKSQSPAIYRMPSSATRAIKGKTVPYTIWYDDSKWKETEKLNAYAEKSLKLIGGGAVAIVVVDNKEFPLDVLGDIVIKNAKENGFENATIVSDEKRLVNGADVLFIHWKANIKGSEVEFLSYIHSGPEGTVMVHTYAPAKDFDKNRKAMENFLNGLVLTSD